MLENNRGGSKISTLLYLLIATLVIYVVIKVVPPYRAYYAMEDEIAQQMQLSEINNQEVILNDIYQKAQELELPIQKEDISITKRDDGGLELTLHWDVEVDFGYGIKRSFPFEINSNNDTAPK